MIIFGGKWQRITILTCITLYPILKYRHLFHFIATLLLKLPICPWILKNYDFATGLKISYIYHNLTKNFSYHTKKTNLQNQIFGAKTKKFNPQTINRGNLFSNLIILNLKKIIEGSRRDLGDPAPVQSQEKPWLDSLPPYPTQPATFPLPYFYYFFN